MILSRLFHRKFIQVWSFDGLADIRRSCFDFQFNHPSRLLSWKTNKNFDCKQYLGNACILHSSANISVEAHQLGCHSLVEKHQQLIFSFVFSDVFIPIYVWVLTQIYTLLFYDESVWFIEVSRIIAIYFPTVIVKKYRLIFDEFFQ